MSSTAIQIQDRATGNFVSAELLNDLAPTDLVVIENEWSPERSSVMQDLLKADVPRPQWPQSLHWDWKRKSEQLSLLESTGLGIVYGKHWQGVMLIKTSTEFARLPPDEGKPLVYIDYLEAAPWNWVMPEICRAGQFRGIGSILFWAAMVRSVEEGFHGRVGLHSLPQSEQFYEKAGMETVGRDPNKQNLLYFELTREQALQRLQEGGHK